uniref:HECT-type E3 ubiquitin transferase n=1 Tax=Alexandrium monilatum TaxID=311494 RepID=A0A7S4SRU5_9DINO
MSADTESTRPGTRQGPRASPSQQPPSLTLSASRTPPERQPLLQRSSAAPTCAWCFLCLTGHQILFFLFVLFLMYLAGTGQIKAWCDSFLLMLNADVVCLGIFAFSTLFAGIVLAMVSIEKLCTQGCCGVTCYLLWLWITATLSWHLLLRMCVLHRLETTCLVSSMCPKIEDHKGHTIPDISGFTNGLLLAWSWLPTGLLLCVAGMLWRPWYCLAYVMPLAIIGKGPVLEMGWWQWREFLIGTVFWLCILLVSLASRSRSFANADVADRRFLLVVGVGLTFLFTALAFYSTTDPFIGFWLFLLRPWVELAHGAIQHKPPKLNVEEWLAAVLMLWGIVRLVYIAASVRLEQWSAQKRMEETLQEALAHPFRAELEQGFGLSQAENQGLVQTLDNMLNGAGTALVGGEGSGSLSEKQKALITARQQSLLLQAGGTAVLPGSLRLRIRREKLLEDTWLALFNRPVSELLAPRISILFEGESGFDVGGLTRDWFDSVGRALTEHVDDIKGSSLLTMAPDQTLIPRPVDCGEPSSLQAGSPQTAQEKFRPFMSLGRFMALAVFHQHPLPLSFSLILCKHLLRVPVGMEDVKQLDPEFYQGRVAQVLREGGPAALAAALGEPLTFVSAPTELRPYAEELKPGGEREVVTEETKTEYVQLLCEAHLCAGIRREIQCLLQGFWDVLPLEVMQHCEVGPRELSVLISGVAELDPDDWRQHSDASNSEVITWFWEIVREINPEQRCMLLHFATGSSRLPPGGFVELKPSFTVSVSDTGSTEHLPQAHTCVNQIVLPRYAEKPQLKSKLLQALSTEDFGLV